MTGWITVDTGDHSGRAATVTMDSLRQDLRYAGRSLLSRPLFAGMVVTVVALGVGANVGIFALAYSLFFQPLPFPGAKRLVTIHETRDGEGFYPSSWANYLDYRANATVFEELVAHYSGAPIQMVSDGDTRMLRGAVVSENYFTTLEIEPQLGRLLVPDETHDPATGAVTVLSHALWQEAFSGDPEVLGRSIELNGTPFVVIGVADADFHGVVVGSANDLWISSAMSAVGYRWCDTFSRDCTYLNMLGRLEVGRTLPEAQTELDHLARQLEETYPKVNRDKGVAAVAATGIHPGWQQSVELTRLLAAIAMAVLLVACANLAGLLLARHRGRRSEMAVRLALGAGPARILQQLLAESVLLALLGGLAGLLVASWSQTMLVRFFSFERAWSTPSLATPVLLFTLGLSVAAGVAFGLWPALTASRLSLAGAITGRGGGPGRREGRVRAALVVAQVAISLALVVATVLLVRSLQRVVGASPFATDTILSLRLRPNLMDYEVEPARVFHRGVLERLRATPEVIAVGLAQGLPYGRYGWPVEITRTGDDPAAGAPLTDVFHDAVSPGFFEAANLTLLRGRDFTDSDGLGAPPVVIVNRTLAVRLWGGEEAVGRPLLLDGEPYEVIGVVPDAQAHSAAEPALPYFYRSFWQLEDPMIDARYCVRGAGDALALVSVARRAAAALDPRVPMSEVATLRSKIETSFRSVELAATVSGFSGGVVVLLAAVGLYGLLALAVAQRRREIGVRMAVGATSQDVSWLVVGGGLRSALLGLALGVPLALLLARALASYLYGVTPLDAGAYLGAGLLLLVVSLLASWVPARRAAAIEPTVALRSE